MKVLLLLSCLVGIAFSCSCYRMKVGKQLCSESTKYVIRVKITEILKSERPTRGYLSDSFTTPPVTTSSNPYSVRVVAAEIQEFYKGSGNVGDTIQLSSGVMDSMCGIGYQLQPGTEFVLSTEDLTAKSVGLCMFIFRVGGWDWDTVQPIISNTDCSCKPSVCKKREGRRVFRGACNDPGAFCARDSKNVCRWYNAESIDSCKSRGWW